MVRIKTSNKRRILLVGGVSILVLFLLIVRVAYVMVFDADFLQQKAYDLHNRERVIKAERGTITDINGVPIAVNQSVTKIAVIHNQITDADKVIQVLSKYLELDEEYVKKKVLKRVALENIKSNVDKEIADKIREYNLDGIVIDEDYRRIYPFENLASHVIGFVGRDNQGIIGLEVVYDQYLKGKNGVIYTTTNAKGIEIDNMADKRIEPISGYHLRTSIDVNMQTYAEQALDKVLLSKNAKRGSIIIMNPQNGEIYTMVNKPDFNLNDPFYLEDKNLSSEEKQKQLNGIWRNYCINDTYEPGSTFKIITSSAGLEEQVVALDEQFYCRGFAVVADRRIRCHKAGGHGAETFVEGVQNSCNPVFMAVGERLGVDRFLKYFDRFGFNEKTGVDLPGEAVSIMHKKEVIGPVELATLSFGQSFQITPLQLLRASASVVNGGTLITPHFGVELCDDNGDVLKEFTYDEAKKSISKETSDTMKVILESVVSVGSGKNGAIEGYGIGGKTATSEKLPRSANKYISSFLGFAPANDPKLMILVLVDEPEGVYYGGTVAAPVAKELFENILPYIGVEKTQPTETEESLKE